MLETGVGSQVFDLINKTAAQTAGIDLLQSDQIVVARIRAMPSRFTIRDGTGTRCLQLRVKYWE